MHGTTRTGRPGTGTTTGAGPTGASGARAAAPAGQVGPAADEGHGGRGLVVDDVRVVYGGGAGAHPAVDGVSLEVEGGVLALLGPSGCGKSSLLRAVAGLEPLAGGDVRWDGRSVVPVPVHRRGFGLLFQDGQLFPHRDVAGNVAYGLPRRGPGALDARARTARVAELLELVGLPGTGPRAVATLSGGERQRVALARALAPRPRLLLLDEPLSALDRALRERLAEDLRTVLGATGTTAVLVTHDQDEAAAVGDRVAVMRAGRLVQVDTPDRLWRAPADAATALFLGFEAVVAPHDPAAPALRAAAGGALDGPAGGTAPSPAPSSSPSLALAPGALVVAGPGERAALHGRVERVRGRRGRTEAVVVVAGLGPLTVRVPGAADAAASPGRDVGLHVDPAGVAVVGGGTV